MYRFMFSNKMSCRRNEDEEINILMKKYSMCITSFYLIKGPIFKIKKYVSDYL